MRLQDEFKLVPLSAYGKPYTPPAGTVDPSIDMKTAVRDQVNRMDAVEYFTLLCELMKTNPPAAADAPIVAKFAAIGIVPGQYFDKSKFKPDFAKRVPQVGFRPHHAALQVQRRRREGHQRLGLHHQNGNLWHRLLHRALITAIGLGANRPQDAVYPTSLKYAGGRSDATISARTNTSSASERIDAAGRWLLVADHV